MSLTLILVLLVGLLFLLILLNPMSQPPLRTQHTVNEDMIWEAVRAGRKVQAIKYYRMLHGTGLKESKQAVEQMMESRPS